MAKKEVSSASLWDCGTACFFVGGNGGELSCVFLKENKQHKTCMDKYPTSTYLTCIISGTWISRKPKSVFSKKMGA